jgi:hypothetical protein
MDNGLDVLIASMQEAQDRRKEKVSWHDLLFRMHCEALSMELQKRFRANPLNLIKYGIGAAYCGLARNKNNADAFLEPIRIYTKSLL